MDGGEGVLPPLSPPPLPLPPAAAAVAAVADTIKDGDDGGGAAVRQACAKGWRVRSRGAESRRGGAVGMKGSRSCCCCCASAWTVWTAPACARQLARSASMRRAFSTSTSTSGAGASAAGVAWSLPMWVPARSSPRLSVDAAPADEVEVEVYGWEEGGDGGRRARKSDMVEECHVEDDGRLETQEKREKLAE